jgi:hypothetical protein
MLKKKRKSQKEYLDVAILKEMNLKKKNTWYDLTPKQQDKYSEINLLRTAKEKFDYLKLNGIYTKDFFKFKSILEFDYSDWKYQKKSETMVRQNYDDLYLENILFNAAPFSISHKRTFINGNLLSARYYILEKVLEKFENRLEQKYPSIFFSPYNDNNNFNSYEMRSLGNEEIRNKIEIYLFIYLRKAIDDYLILFKDKIDTATFLVHEDNILSDAIGTDIYIIGGKKVASKIKPKTFFYDFQEYIQPSGYLDIKIEEIFNIFVCEYDQAVNTLVSQQLYLDELGEMTYKKTNFVLSNTYRSLNQLSWINFPRNLIIKRHNWQFISKKIADIRNLDVFVLTDHSAEFVNADVNEFFLKSDESKALLLDFLLKSNKVIVLDIYDEEFIEKILNRYKFSHNILIDDKILDKIDMIIDDSKIYKNVVK